MILTPTFVADFETIQRDNIEDIWLFDICNIVNLRHKTGYTMQEFLNIIDNAKTSCKIYFHNLKFDGSFITDYLLKNGCKMSCEGGLKLKKGSFFLLVTEFGSFFKLQYKNKNNKIISIIDSLKLIPLAVSKIAKDFKLPISKGTIDYKKPRPKGYIPTENELEYVKKDTEIVAYAIKYMLDNGHDKLTISGCAFEEFKKTIGKVKYSDYFGKWENNNDLTLDKEIRGSYRGGFCQVNPMYKAKTIKQPVFYYDVNSLYPYIMRSYPLPVGMPIHGVGKCENNNKYFIQKIIVNMEVKEGHIPCILDKNQYMRNDKYIIDTQNGIENTTILTLTCFDLELLYKNYYIYHIEYIEYWIFETKNDIFKNYVDKYTEKKIQADKDGNGALRLLCKLLLNSLYGKFGQNPERCRKVPYIGEDNILHFDTTQKQVATKFHYLPIATFITSLARKLILDQIEVIGYKNWVYSDTDSILSLVPFNDNLIDDRELGKFKVEHIFKKTRVLGPKSYWGIDTTNNITCKLCGCEKGAVKNLPIGKFNYNQIIKNGRKMLVSVEGGKRLIDIDFTIKDRK